MNELNISPTARRIMAIVAVIFGLFMTIVGPFLVQMAITNIMNTLVPKIPTDPHFAGPFLMVYSFFNFFYRGFGVVAGIVLVIIAIPLWKGKSWAWPTALSCISFPTMLTMISVIPHIAHVGSMSPSIVIVMLGLVSYWIILLLPKGVKGEKLARFSVFTLLGLLGGELSIFVMHNVKELAQAAVNATDLVDASILTEPATAIIGFSLPLNFVSLLLCIAAIPLLAARNPKGWWFALSAGVIGMVANYPTQIVRMVTVDFLIAGVMSTLLVILVLIPSFKVKLIGEKEK